ncbi:MAG: DIP1984 family protein [Ilumatobacteraceae bacterium]
MKLAEALSMRADAQRRLAQLQARATAAARYQEGEPPVEDASALLAAARDLTVELEAMIRRINRTNAATGLEPGLTVTDAIARRDALAMRRKLVVAVADAAVGDRGLGYGRQLRSELRYVTDLPVAELRREADDLARDHRQLDTQLQEANWATELAP